MSDSGLDRFDFDVVQIGFGPVGQVAAALLGRYGHRVGVFERWPSPYPLPRAGHVDHEVMRVFQSVGAADAVERRAIPVPDYDWFNADGKLLLHLDWDAPTPSGWKSDYLMYQPYMEDALTAAVERRPSVTVHRGQEAVRLTRHDDHAAVTVRDASGAERTVTARYVLGADGAGSFVREAAGLAREDFGFAEDWLVADVRPYDADARLDMPDAGQICDPARPVSLFRWLGREHCRWEFMLLPGEDTAGMDTDETVWRLLARWDVTPANAALVRRTVYTFRSLLAEDFRAGRVLLLGDAAHLMPPFLGQGMCSGVRDAANLAWKLDLVLRGVAPDALLDTYALERRPHVERYIRASMELGRVVCELDPDAAAERDRALLAGEAPPPPAPPWIERGVLQGGGASGGTGGGASCGAGGSAGADVVGRLGVQGRVLRAGVTGLADDVLGPGWTLLCARADAPAALSAGHRALLAALGARTVHVSRAATGAPDAVVDLDATYARWFAATGAEAVLVRPDHHVFGTAGTADELPGLLDELARRLGVPVTPG
ncbi:bifunctional 3-(3-hydroxy-phenyl)propionate/3-hydroxycinnamic acid hydroxylase [Streptomyces sp. NPDC048172]|uniref:bifunctional 3-(3-hydroxy-phenyl)propionate/3-hydroxycinnamic acid hydroxylase MhpA n=1 Tax=Streptomyces sp. NPDC048172 TaxID=3365505 RepID=UPI00372034DA